MAVEDRIHRQVTERLVGANQVYTRGRRAIVEALAGAGSPVTLPELLERAPSLTQSSAYRNLALMEEADVVRRLVGGADYARYELAEDITGHHHHVICTHCGTVRDFTLDKRIERTLDSAFDRAARSAGFLPVRHDIDVYGVCQDCATD